MSDATAISAEQMKLVLDVSRRLTVTADLDDLLKHIAHAATSLLDTERASIFLHDPQRRQLWTKVALRAGEIRVPDTAGIVGHVFQTGQIVEVPRPYEDARFNPEIDRHSGFVTRNLLSAPLKDIDGRTIGVLQALNRRVGGFTSNDWALVELLADHAGVAIQRFSLQEQVLRAAGLRHEMELARNVQMAMIPRQPPEVRNLRAAGWMRAASMTGGDCYDLWETADGRLGVLLADASGHGMAPALVVSQTRTLARVLMQMNNEPAQVLLRINERLANDLEAGRFVTVFLAWIASDGLVNWCSAGHGPILLRQSASAQFEMLKPPGPPIGMLPEISFDPLPPIRLQRGGMLVVMSDGIFEAKSGCGEFMSVQQIVQVLDESRSAGPAEALSRVQAELKRWQQKDEPADDQTFVAVQYLGQSA